MDEVRQVNRHTPPPTPAPNPVLLRLNDLGKSTVGAREDITIFLQMLGALFMAVIGVLRRPRSLRLTSLIYQLYRIGWQAIPIVVLITFLIRGIIAQQGFSISEGLARIPTPSTWSASWCCASSAC